MDIKIVGHSGSFKYEDVESQVVQIGGKYHMRDSNELTRIGGKYYRKKAPLIAMDYQNRYMLKSEGVLTIHGVYAHKDDPNILKSGKGLMLKHFCVEVAGVWYDKTDPKIIRD